MPLTERDLRYTCREAIAISRQRCEAGELARPRNLGGSPWAFSVWDFQEALQTELGCKTEPSAVTCGELLARLKFVQRESTGWYSYLPKLRRARR